MINHINLKYENELYSRIPVPGLPVSFAGSNSGGRIGCDRLAFISLKSAGDMSVSLESAAINREAFFNELNIEKEDVLALHEIHSKKVFFAAEIKGKPAGTVNGDGLISMKSNKVLSVTVADCLPILLLDKKSCCFGLLHSGWRGTGIVVEAVKKMEAGCRSDVENISVVIGPGIGVCCYEVSKDVYGYFKNTFGHTSAVQRDGSYFVDLREANINLLNRIGVRNITVVDDCTSCNINLHSYRRDGREGFGTMMVLFGKL